MVSLTQMDKCRELTNAGYQSVPQRSENPRIGGPTLMRRALYEYILVRPDGTVEDAPTTVVRDW